MWNKLKEVREKISECLCRAVRVRSVSRSGRGAVGTWPVAVESRVSTAASDHCLSMRRED